MNYKSIFLCNTVLLTKKLQDPCSNKIKKGVFQYMGFYDYFYKTSDTMTKSYLQNCTVKHSQGGHENRSFGRWCHFTTKTRMLLLSG